MRYVILCLEPPQRLLLRYPALQHGAHQLSRSYTGQCSPDRFFSSGAQHGAIDCKLQNLLAQTVRMNRIRQEFISHRGAPEESLTSVVIQAAGRGHSFASVQPDFHPLPVGLFLRVFGSLPRKQRHEHLFRGILILMSFIKQFHNSDYTRALPERQCANDPKYAVFPNNFNKKRVEIQLVFVYNK